MEGRREPGIQPPPWASQNLGPALSARNRGCAVAGAEPTSGNKQRKLCLLKKKQPVKG